METLTEIAEILRNTKTIEDLQKINRLAVEEIRTRRKIEALSARGKFKVGQNVILKDIRPKKLIGQKATILSIKSTNAIVRIDGEHFTSDIPLVCFEAI